MFRFVLVLSLALLATPAAALATPGPQALGIDMRTSELRVDRLERYVTTAPITLRMTAPQFSSAAVIGVAPDGSHVRIPLAAGADGAYTATVTLSKPGMWSLAVQTKLGSLESVTGNFPVVVAEGPSPTDAAFMIALAAASICGGVGLIAVGRSAALHASA